MNEPTKNIQMNEARSNKRKWERNKALVEDRLSGLPFRALAKKYGLAVTRVIDICTRDMPDERA